VVVSPDQFGQFKVREMTESDFFLGSATPTALKSPKCHILLFYEPATVDPNLIDIWNYLAQTIGGPVIGAVNVSARTEIMDAFFATAQDPDHPLNDYTISGVPTILVYRNRWPQAFYNGELSYDALHKWILVLACKPGYKERDSTFIGVESVQASEYAPDRRIEGYPWPTSSRDYTAETGERSTRLAYAEGEEEEGEEEEGLETGYEEGEEEEGAMENEEEEEAVTPARRVVKRPPTRDVRQVTSLRQTAPIRSYGVPRSSPAISSSSPGYVDESQL